MNGELHNHYYRGITTFEDGHVHGYYGVTSSDPDRPGHTHYMVGYTTFDDGHVHYYVVETGPSIEVEGGHYHLYSGPTAVADRHIHYLAGNTSLDE